MCVNFFFSIIITFSKIQKHAHLVHVEDDDAAPPDFSPGVIAAIAIGASCLLAIITGVVYIFCRKRSASGQGSCNKVANVSADFHYA